MTSREWKLRQLAEAFRESCPSERDILMLTGEYNQWKRDVAAVANAFDIGLDEIMAKIRMDK